MRRSIAVVAPSPPGLVGTALAGSAKDNTAIAAVSIKDFIVLCQQKGVIFGVERKLSPCFLPPRCCSFASSLLGKKRAFLSRLFVHFHSHKPFQLNFGRWASHLLVSCDAQMTRVYRMDRGAEFYIDLHHDDQMRLDKSNSLRDYQAVQRVFTRGADSASK